MSQTEKNNLWSISILLIILLGIVLISISIKISTMQSIDTDQPYNLSKTNMNIQVNAILSQQNEFEQFYTPYIGINKIPLVEKENILKSPYYDSSVPRDIPLEQERLHGNDRLYLLFHENEISRDNTKPQIESILLEIVRLVPGNKKMDIITIPMSLDSENIYKSDEFSFPLRGYYQAYFKITLKNTFNNSESANSMNKTAKSTQNILQESSHKLHINIYQNEQEELLESQKPLVVFSRWIFNDNVSIIENGQ
ncbi:hypothetical protein CQA53_02055 [Helicobacter didelphidarum]|uniref:Uncharacterized protein n=1 Tax=Helicobacter didelphidarum TaxID=2040648 RepID=A0A3D8IQ68_9HELI|nr:hypothetical protein [Helicobacter didelphidarum]RDU67065.1 hypothetical protein CQA53_02055 [Helicobacter didelphidarum]